MKLQTKSLQLLIFNLLLVLVLAACVLPTPGAEEAANATATPETILVPTEVPVQENPVTDGGDTTTDGGDTAVDGGDAATDGGDTTADGGDAATDGGDTNTDGGVPPTAPDGYVYHTVQAGETLYSISLLYGVSMEAIAEANNMQNELIVVGQQLLIPRNAEPVQPIAPTPPPTQPLPPQTVTVQPGQNLFRIGLQYGYSAYELAACNNIPNPHLIYVGQVIKIPPNC